MHSQFYIKQREPLTVVYIQKHIFGVTKIKNNILSMDSYIPTDKHDKGIYKNNDTHTKMHICIYSNVYAHQNK